MTPLSLVFPELVFEESLIGSFEIDEFGDVVCTGHVVAVKDGKFVIVSKRNI